MKFLNRFASWFRSLFQSDDIPLRVILPDGRRLYDNHPLVRHGLVTSLKHNRSLVYTPPIRMHQWEDPDAPPVCVGRGYLYMPYMVNKGLSPTSKVEAMYGFFQDAEFGVDYRKMVGPAWRRHIQPSTIFWSVCLIASAAIFLYANTRNDFEGFRFLMMLSMELATWTTDRAMGVYSSLPEEPHWIIMVGIGPFLPLLLQRLTKLAWSSLRRFGRRKRRWWEPPSD